MRRTPEDIVKREVQLPPIHIQLTIDLASPCRSLSKNAELPPGIALTRLRFLMPDVGRPVLFVRVEETSRRVIFLKFRSDTNRSTRHPIITIFNTYVHDTAPRPLSSPMRTVYMHHYTRNLRRSILCERCIYQSTLFM